MKIVVLLFVPALRGPLIYFAPGPVRALHGLQKKHIHKYIKEILILGEYKSNRFDYGVSILCKHLLLIVTFHRPDEENYNGENTLDSNRRRSESSMALEEEEEEEENEELKI